MQEVLWSLATSHDTLLHFPADRGFGPGPPFGWRCLRCGQRQRGHINLQVVFCVDSQQRRLCSVGAIGGATACKKASFCNSNECSGHEPAEFNVMFSLGALQTGHGSNFSHLESAKEVMMTECWKGAQWRVRRSERLWSWKRGEESGRVGGHVDAQKVQFAAHGTISHGRTRHRMSRKGAA